MKTLRRLRFRASNFIIDRLYKFTVGRRWLRQALYDAHRKDWFVINPTGDVPFILHTGDRVISRELYRDGFFDSDKLQLSQRWLPDLDGAVLVDVGANIGSICVDAVAKGVFPTAIAIEPEPNNYRLLRANVALNGLEDRIKCIRSAVGSTDGESLRFELSPSNKGDHRVRTTSESGLQGEHLRDEIEVRSDTLDTVLQDVEGRIVLWIDTQGFEGFVLEGAKNTIEKRVPMVIEFWPYALKRSGSFDKLIDGLTPYSTFVDLRQDDPFEQKATAERLRSLAEQIGFERGSTDLLFR